MKRSAVAVILGVIILLSGCKGKNDVLATYTGGSIKRGEFYDWIESKHFVKDTIVKSKKNQKAKLEMMAMDKFAIEEAQKSGFDKSEEFKVFADMATEAQLMDILYSKEIKDKAKFKENAIRVSQIILRPKDIKIENNKQKQASDAEMKKELAELILKAKEIIVKLDKGEKFEELAKQNSSDFSKKNGGDIGYIISDMMPPEFSNVAFSLKEGAYTKEPVQVLNAVYIIKVTDKEELTEKNIEKVIKDKMQAQRIKNRFYSKASKSYIDELMKASDVQTNLEKVTSRNKKDVIFKVGTTVFTVEDLDKRIAMYTGKFTPNAPSPTVNDEQRKSLAENFLKFELLKRVAVQKGIDKDPDYIKKVVQKRDAILAREYMKKIGSAKIIVSEADMREEYNTNKDKRYYTMVNKGNDRVKAIEPYGKVRERIKKILENKKQSDSIKNWKDELIKGRSLKIIEKELEGE